MEERKALRRNVVNVSIYKVATKFKRLAAAASRPEAAE